MDVSEVPTVTEEHLATIAQVLLERVGLDYRGERLPLLASSVQHHMKMLDISSFSEYIALVLENDAEWERLVNLISVTESSFYRHPEIVAAVTHLLKELHRKRSLQAPLQIWSAAAALGQEPYTLAMAALDSGVALERRVIIWATDINTDALRKAREGRYPPECAASLPPAWRNRYVVWNDDGTWSPSPEVRRLVRFQRFNLKTLAEGAQPPFMPDIIVSANVLIYFPADLARDVLVRLASLLPRDGALFVDKAMAYLARDVLSPVDVGGVIGYRLNAYATDMRRKKHRRERSKKRRRSARSRRPLRLLEDIPARIKSRAAGKKKPERPRTVDTPLQECEILALIDSGRWEEAEQHLRAWQEQDPLAFEPYFLLARLYRMQEEWHRARECYERALYLCPSLAVGHLEYGNLLRLLGDTRAAHSAYRHALQAAARDRESQRFGFSPPLVRRLAERALSSIGRRRR